MSHPISRRRFLGQLNCAAISSLPIISTLLNLKLAGSAAAAAGGDGHRALVWLFLSGGIALPQSALRPITPLGTPGLQLGLHPQLAGVQSMFESGQAAFVANVGTLVEPVTKDEYDNGLKHLPLGLYSHSDQVEQWHTSTPNVRSPKGWGGRMGDLLRTMNSNETVSMN